VCPFRYRLRSYWCITNVCMCVCLREREKERKRVCVCVCECVCKSVYVRAFVCVCAGVCVFLRHFRFYCGIMYFCKCVCERERVHVGQRESMCVWGVTERVCVRFCVVSGRTGV